MPLCNLCREIRPRTIAQAERQPHYASSVGELHTSAQACELCALFLQSIPSDLKHDAESRLVLLGENGNFGGPPRSVGKPYQGLSLRYLDLGLEGKEQGHWQEGPPYFKRLDVFAESDSPAAVSGDVIGRPVKSADSISQAREWIDICRSKHKCISHKQEENVVLPTRVLDLAKLTPNGDPVLFESAGVNQSYIALSHRWGGAKILTTTKSNLESHKQAIPSNQLCATFQDAVNFTRKLGYRFLWIDSLCIVQDDPEDWKREAAKMADVYRNADLTLSAACATSGDSGLFQPRKECEVVKMPYFAEDGSIDGFYYIGDRTGTIHDIEQEVTDGSLNTRAWVLQERSLSPRTLHFGKTQLLWECKESAWEESCIMECLCPDRFGNGPAGFGGYGSLSFVGKGEAFVHRPGRPRYWADHLYSTDYLYPIWYHLVESYMRRGLTKGSDKLPAISGLARVFAEFVGTYKEDGYLAGLWENDFAHGLVWCSQAEKGLVRHEEIAPSWSWAGWEGPVSYIEVERLYSYEMMLVDVAFTRADVTADLFGGSGAITARLTGYLAPIRTGPYLESSTVDTRGLGYLPMKHMNTTILDGDGASIGCGWLDDEAAGDEKIVYSLVVFKALRSKMDSTILEIDEFMWCLLLEEMGSNLYKRVGLGQVYRWSIGNERRAIAIS